MPMGTTWHPLAHALLPLAGGDRPAGLSSSAEACVSVRTMLMWCSRWPRLTCGRAVGKGAGEACVSVRTMLMWCSRCPRLTCGRGLAIEGRGWVEGGVRRV